MTFFRSRAVLLAVLAVIGLGGVRNARSAVVINEIMATNQATTRSAETKNYSDWIELYNTSGVEANISGFFLTDSPASPTKWQVPPNTIIAPLGHLLIWIDDTDIFDPYLRYHASFRLDGTDGEHVVLFRPDGRTTESAVAFGHQPPDVSYGRLTDEMALLVPFHTPTPGKPNNGYDGFRPPPASLKNVVFINEWMAQNTSYLPMWDPSDKKFEDWIELYNNWDYPIDLGDYYMTDRTTQPMTYKIPKGNIIPAKGFTIFWADNDDEDGPTHAKFNLSAGGENILLIAKDGSTVIDRVQFGPQTANISEGRKPDGAATRIFFPMPTPYMSNEHVNAVKRWTLFR